MRYQVPQFTDIEDKVIGPLTLKQFLISLGTVLALVPVYLITDLPLFVTLAVPVGGIAALFAHFKLHGKSLFVIAGQALLFMSKGQQHIWKRVAGAPLLEVKGEEYTDVDETTVSAPSLAERARELATKGRVVSDDVADPFDPDAEVDMEVSGAAQAQRTTDTKLSAQREAKEARRQSEAEGQAGNTDEQK